MKNLKEKKLYLRVYDELKRYIARRTMKPGDKLPTEMELSETLGVSRNVLREAVKALEITGVVSSKPGVGMVLNGFNSNFLSSCLFLNLIGDGVNLVEQSQVVRKTLEMGFASQCFDSITPTQITRLEKTLVKMQKTDNPSDFYDIDNTFHKIMYENVGNDVLLAFIDSAWACEKYYRTRWLGDKEFTCDKHQRILDALKKHNYDEFMEALHYHYEYKFKTKIENTTSNLSNNGEMKNAAND